jgi:hypothetical protein
MKAAAIDAIEVDAIGAIGAIGAVNQGRRIRLILYTSPNTIHSARALKNMARILADYDEGAIVFDVCDIVKYPDSAARDGIAFTPTLVRHYPAPRAWVIGDLDEGAVVRRMLETAGVARRGGAQKGDEGDEGDAADLRIWSLLRRY